MRKEVQITRMDAEDFNKCVCDTKGTARAMMGIIHKNIPKAVTNNPRIRKLMALEATRRVIHQLEKELHKEVHDTLMKHKNKHRYLSYLKAIAKNNEDLMLSDAEAANLTSKAFVKRTDVKLVKGYVSAFPEMVLFNFDMENAKAQKDIIKRHTIPKWKKDQEKFSCPDADYFG